MTIQQILAALRTKKKNLTRRQLYRYLGNLNIKPVGFRQRPQQYPDDAPARVLTHFGLMTDEEHALYVHDCMAGHAAIYNKPARIAKLTTMQQLKATRSKAKGGRK